MKAKITLLSLLAASPAIAHDDHFLNASAHELYHGVFWLLALAVAVKGIQWGLKQLQKRDRS